MSTNFAVSFERESVGSRQSTAIVILGARSGTSALAGTLGLLGCTLPDHMMAANWANTKGYFEPQDLADLHDELLASVGSVWHDWRPFPTDWYQSSEAQKFRERIVDVYRANYGNAMMSVIKEPRMCRFLPLWDGIFADIKIKPVFILIDRNPFEVAASLAARDGSSLEQGALYYIRNHLDAERDTRGRQRAFISYDALLKNWRATIAGAAQCMKIKLNPTPKQAADIDSFLERGLRNHVYTLPSLDDELHNIVYAVHDAYKELALGQPETQIQNRLDTIRVRFDRLSSVLAGKTSDTPWQAST